jgi:hypothetical protein
MMAKTLLVVRAEVPDPADRAEFDEWYRTDHLPLALETFGALRGWRCWSRSDPAVHFAFYEFASPAEAAAATAAERIAPLVADFDRVWGGRTVRRREILEVVQEMAR